MENIKFACEKCNAEFEVDHTAVGSEAECVCGHSFIISTPSLEDEHAAAAVTAPIPAVKPSDSLGAAFDQTAALPKQKVKKPKKAAPGAKNSKPASQKKAVAPAKSGSGLNIAAIIFVLLAIPGLYGGYYLYKQSQADKLAKQKKAKFIAAAKKATQQTARKQPKVTKVFIKPEWDAAIKQANQVINGSGDYEQAIAGFNTIIEKYPKNKYAGMAAYEIANIKNARWFNNQNAINTLHAKARQFALKGQFAEAAAVYKNYSGPSQQETAKQRLQLANDITEFQQNLKNRTRHQEQLARVADAIVDGKLDKALKAFQASGQTNHKLEAQLATLAKANSMMLNKIKDYKDREITLSLKNGKKEKVFINGLSKGRICGEIVMGKAKIKKYYSLSDLSYKTRLSLLQDADKSTKQLYLFSVFADSGRIAKAVKLLKGDSALKRSLAKALMLNVMKRPSSWELKGQTPNQSIKLAAVALNGDQFNQIKNTLRHYKKKTAKRTIAQLNHIVKKLPEAHFATINRDGSNLVPIALASKFKSWPVACPVTANAKYKTNFSTVSLEEIDYRWFTQVAKHPANTPRPSNYLFEAENIKTYLKTLDTKTARGELARYDLIKDLKFHIIQLINKSPFDKTELKLKNGDTLHGKIMVNDSHISVINSGKPTQRVKWGELSFDQLISFFEHYLNQRMAMVGAGEVNIDDIIEDVTEEYMALAVFCDWYNQPKLTLDLLRKGIMTDPRLITMANANIFNFHHGMKQQPMKELTKLAMIIRLLQTQTI